MQIRYSFTHSDDVSLLLLDLLRQLIDSTPVGGVCTRNFNLPQKSILSYSGYGIYTFLIYTLIQHPYGLLKKTL